MPMPATAPSRRFDSTSDEQTCSGEQQRNLAHLEGRSTWGAWCQHDLARLLAVRNNQNTEV
jgi:hypothetical protein